jgi:quercetin dioxygenase-like cupin family protein
MKTHPVTPTQDGRTLPSTPGLAQRRTRRWSAVVAVLALTVPLLLVLAPPAAATRDQAGERAALQGRMTRSLSVIHGPAVTTLTTTGSDGHQLGDLRVVSLPLSRATTARGEADRLDATLLTTGIDQPGPGDEIRISTLVFTLGDAADQVVVTGSGVYPAAGSTIAIDSAIVRPIVGGSGRFAGASGWAESEHLVDDSWRHTLHITSTEAQLRRAEPRPRALRPLPRERPSSSDAEVVSTLLGMTEPAAAVGQTLGLRSYVIPSGVALPPHTHPGTQLARILRGVLRYEVVSGEAHVVRSDGTPEAVVAGEVVMLEAGDVVIEGPGMVHFGTNVGRGPVHIISATLFETGAPPSTLTEMPAISATPSLPAGPATSPAP